MTLDAAFFIIKCCRDAALSDPTYATRRQWSIIKTRGTRPDGSAWQLNRHLNITRNCMQFAQQQQRQQQECCNKRGGFAASNVGQAPAAEMVGERGRGVLMMRSFEHLLPLGSARKFFSLVELMMSVHSSLRSLFRQGDAWRHSCCIRLGARPLKRHPLSHHACHSGNKSSTKQPA